LKEEEGIETPKRKENEHRLPFFFF